MATRILSNNSMACLYCSTTSTAFGPVFRSEDEKTAFSLAQDFCTFLEPTDPRTLTPQELESKTREFFTLTFK